VRELLNHIDDSPERQSRWTGQFIKQAFRERIKSCERIGAYKDPEGNKLDVLIIHLSKDTMLERGRAFLRNFVADYLATGHGNDKDAVLAAYISPNGEDWRFSFVKLEYTLEQTESGRVKTNKELTPARRYSFLVGENERSHTAQTQFLPLLQNDQSDPLLSEIEDAFKIEKVTKEFFAQYKNLFDNTCDELNKQIENHKDIESEFLRLIGYDERLPKDRTQEEKEQREKQDKELEEFVANFAKKLLGQIVFLYFLQKKGWFGVEKNAAWGTGDKHFLRYLFEHRKELGTRQDRKGNRPINFFNDILEHLFYDALNTERANHYYGRFDCRIPFLNGGLFEPMQGYKWESLDILLPDSLFSNNERTKEGDEGTGILDVFDRYNFTVNEAEPLETEVAVDPEMLGKVFENLLPENLRHKGGTYYTPRVIVHYMCQQSLINYLATHLDKVRQAASLSNDREDSELSPDRLAACRTLREDLETFIVRGEVFREFEAHQRKDEKNTLPESVRKRAKEIDRLLADITVCDPAIGSGAFPVGMMQEIVKARCTLASIEGMPDCTNYELKRHAIENSLYGVDIDPGAIEIARLRLWLSLVVDEDDFKEIQPLPNLDYKIMQGNSLLEEFAGVKLLDDDLIAQAFMDKDAQLAALNERINELQDQFFELDRQGIRDKEIKKKMVKEIESLKSQKKELHSPTTEAKAAQVTFQDLHSQARQKLEELKRLHKEFFAQSSPSKKKTLRAKLEQLEWDFMEATLKERGESEALKELKKHRRDNRKNFFLWKLHFVDIFQGKGGFDVIIGNPPYMRVQGIQETQPELVPSYRANYKAAQGSFDLYGLFIERGYKLLGDKGEFAYIVPHKFFQASFGKALRELLMRHNAMRHVVRFGAEQVFENPTTYTCLLFLSNQPQNKFNLVEVTDMSDADRLISAIANHQSHEGYEIGTFESPQNDDWDFTVGKKGEVLEKLARQDITLGDITRKIFQGLATSADKIYILEIHKKKWDTTICFSKILEREVEIENGLIKPFLMGKNVHRYETLIPKNVVIFPYLIKNDSAELMTQSFIRKNFPLGWDYLKENKKALSDRERGRMYGENFYAYIYPKNLTEFETIKIMTPEIALGCQMTIDSEGKLYHTTKVYSFIFLDNVNDDRKYFLGVLNSKVLWFFLQATGYVLRGGYFTFKTEYLKPFPIPCSLSKNPPSLIQQKQIALLVDYILFLKANVSEEDSRDQLMISYFEQIIDALVYELYLTDEIHAAGKRFFEPLSAESLPALDEIKGDKLNALRKIFERLFDRNHIIRQNIFFLDTIESVRIIEGKA